MKKVLFVLALLLVSGLFTLPSISRTYKFEAQAQEVKYSECGLEDICVAPWLEYDEATADGYVKMSLFKAGLGDEVNFVVKMINCESTWKTDAVNANNSNGSYDLGLWQINSIHKNISNEDKFNFKKATDWSINKRLHDGNWSAWSCSRKVK